MLNAADTTFLDTLRSRLSSGAVREVEPRYLEEPRGLYHGQAAAVVAPSDTGEVSAVIRAAAEARVGIIPYGGGTGLVSGQIASDVPAPILLSLERMTRIRAVYPEENTLVAEAGVVLADIHRAAEDAGRLFPLMYGSYGSARIGGALSVNSGGLNVLRYGMARDLCLGIEAVLPDGTMFHGLKRLRKDNTGYDLRNLLIGAEGTLGVITAAALRLYPRPARRSVALIEVTDPAAALSLLSRAGRIAGETVSGFELLSGQGFRFMEETGMTERCPLDRIPDWAVLIEIATPVATDPDAMMEALFAEALEAGEASDGIVARSETQRNGLWALREAFPEANRKVGAVASHDIALPLSVIPEFFARARPAVESVGPFRINAFGHLGDGNLHFNAFPPKGRMAREYDALRARVTRVLHDLAMELEGTFSAEHGLGRAKVGELERYGDPGKLVAMRTIKAALDPLGIMNPGAVLRMPVPERS